MGKLFRCKKKLKVGIILDCAPYVGGSFQYAQSLLDALASLDKTSYQVIAIYIDPLWKAYLRSYNGLFSRKISSNYYFSAQNIDAMYCDIVISSAQGNWAERLETPVVVPIHDLMHRYETRFSEVSANGEYQAREYLYHGMLEHAIAVLVDSTIGKKQVIASYGDFYRDKIYKLPFTVPKYLYNEDENVSFKIPFQKYIFYPAQFWKHKNHKKLLEAIYLLKKMGVEVNAIFVGSAKNADLEVRDMIEQMQLSKNISILGYVSNAVMRILYKKARALIMPTFFGPTNIPPLEAMMLGCPVGVSRIYGMPDQLGDASLYFSPDSAKEIAIVIKEYWQDDNLCQEMKKRGFEHIALYSPKIFNERFKNILDKVVCKLEYLKKEWKPMKTFCMAHQNVYIYGAGEYAYYVKCLLRKMGVKTCSFIVTAINESMEEYMETPVQLISEVSLADNDGIICAVSEKYQNEIKAELIKRNVTPESVFYISTSNINSLYGHSFR